MATRDGGTKWEAQSSPVEEMLNSVAFLSDGQRGWAVSSDGTIIATRDGGTKWEAQSSPVKESLCSVTFLSDGQRGWAVGDNGTIVATRDGGAKWEAQSSPVNEPHLSVTFLSDGQRGWAVGTDGTILATRDGGTKWEVQSSPVKEHLHSVTFLGDGQRGWAVGGNGTVLATRDGGATWVDPRRYSRSPAPIFYPLLALAGVPLAFAMRKRKAAQEPGRSIEDVFNTDAALSAEEAAGTQVGRLGLGLAAYLRNRKTRSPIVLAVSGPWGAGKSSVLNVLRAELERDGYRTASFNAWHHQSEEHLLAALLSVLRGAALPPWWSWLGWRVRARLLWARAGRMWLRLLLGLAGAVFAVTVVVNLGLDFESLWALDKVENILKTLAVPAAILPVVALWQVFTAFGVTPEKVAGSLWRKSSAVRETVSQRVKFAEEFAEVTWALQPRALTIFIDDLDRCRPEQMLATLEVVNFLACSGQCYVGLATEENVVRHCIEQELDWLKDLPAETSDGEAGAGAPLRADLWLEKLIQVRLHVAKPTDDEYGRMIGRQQEAVPRQERLKVVAGESDFDWLWSRAGRFLRGMGIALAVFGLVSGTVWLAYHAGGPLGEAVKQRQEKETARKKTEQEEKDARPPAWLANLELTGKLNGPDVTVRVAKPAKPTVPAAEKEEPVKPKPEPPVVPVTPVEPKDKAVVSIHPAQTAPLNWWHLGLTALGCLVAARWVLGIRDPKLVEDSQTFSDTLVEFAPCIQSACPTPRAVKQLINRVRLYAMLLRNWDGKPEPKNTPDAEANLREVFDKREGDLVIFGIIERLVPKQLDKALALPDSPPILLPGDLARFNERAEGALRSLLAPEFRKHFVRLLRALGRAVPDELTKSADRADG